MVYLACQHAIKIVVMLYDRVVFTFERFEWLDLAHVHTLILVVGAHTFSLYYPC